MGCSDRGENKIVWWSLISVAGSRCVPTVGIVPGRSRGGSWVGWRRTRIEGGCINSAAALAQVRERHEMHIVCVHLNKDKCQISMAPGSLHVR